MIRSHSALLCCLALSVACASKSKGSDNPDAGQCMTTHLYRFATGNSEPDGEIDMIAAIASGYPEAGPTFDDMIVELMRSVGFRHYAEEAGQ